MLWIGYLFDLLAALILVHVAKRRRDKCTWDWNTARRKMWWGIFGVLAVQIGGLILLAQGSPGVGIRGLIQWPCIYLVALAVYRRGDLKAEEAKPTIESRGLRKGGEDHADLTFGPGARSRRPRITEVPQGEHLSSSPVSTGRGTIDRKGREAPMWLRLSLAGGFVALCFVVGFALRYNYIASNDGRLYRANRWTGNVEWVRGRRFFPVLPARRPESNTTVQSRAPVQGQTDLPRGLTIEEVIEEVYGPEEQQPQTLPESLKSYVNWLKSAYPRLRPISDEELTVRIVHKYIELYAGESDLPIPPMGTEPSRPSRLPDSFPPEFFK